MTHPLYCACRDAVGQLGITGMFPGKAMCKGEKNTGKALLLSIVARHGAQPATHRRVCSVGKTEDTYGITFGSMGTTGRR